jgi:hypothetical protein
VYNDPAEQGPCGPSPLGSIGATMPAEPLCDILTRPADEAVRGFMERWHGATPADHALRASVRLPRVLADFYRAYGTAADAWLVNRLQAPDDLRQDEEDAAFLVFYVEEQAVYLWAIRKEDLDADDPPVWCRENEPGRPWVQDAPSMSVFLVQMLVMSAALSGPHAACAAWLSREDTEAALGGLRQLDLPPWHWPGYPARWYAGVDAVAFTCPNWAPGSGEDPELSVWVSALSDDGVRFLAPHISNAWEYYSPRDG